MLIILFIPILLVFLRPGTGRKPHRTTSKGKTEV
jgi:hypothetical protein